MLTLKINEQTNQIWLTLHVAVPLVSAYLILIWQIANGNDTSQSCMVGICLRTHTFNGAYVAKVCRIVTEKRRGMVVKTGVIYLKWPDSAKVMIFLYTVKYKERKKMLKIYCILYKFIVLKIQLQKFINLFYFIKYLYWIGLFNSSRLSTQCNGLPPSCWFFEKNFSFAFSSITFNDKLIVCWLVSIWCPPKSMNLHALYRFTLFSRSWTNF